MEPGNNKAKQGHRCHETPAILLFFRSTMQICCIHFRNANIPFLLDVQPVYEKKTLMKKKNNPNLNLSIVSVFFYFDVASQSLTLIKVRGDPDAACLRLSIEKPIHSSGDWRFRTGLNWPIQPRQILVIEYMNSRPQSSGYLQA